jgi:hypothetical protein
VCVLDAVVMGVGCVGSVGGVGRDGTVWFARVEVESVVEGRRMSRSLSETDGASTVGGFRTLVRKVAGRFFEASISMLGTVGRDRVVPMGS